MIRNENLTVGNLAKQCGVNLETVRYYEGKGLLPKPHRTPSGYRIYNHDSVRRLRFIKHAQHLGFSIKEIKELLALKSDPRTTCANVRQKANDKISEIESKVNSLLAMKETLQRLTRTCAGSGPISECPILDSLDIDLTFPAARSGRKAKNTSGKE